MFYERLKESVPSDSVWIMYSSEGNEPYFKKFVSRKTIVPAVSLVSRNNIVLLVHSLDADNIEDFSGEKVIYSGRASIVTEINKSLQSMGMPKNIYLNYSDDMDAAVDILGHGTYKFLYKNIANFYEGEKKKVEFHSADSIIYSLIDKKTEEDIKYMSISAKRALEIIKDVFKEIKPGMTEKDIFNFFFDDNNNDKTISVGCKDKKCEQLILNSKNERMRKHNRLSLFILNHLILKN